MGGGSDQSAIKNGNRPSGATAFLKPALKRNNLKTITYARVDKILFQDKKAQGVQYEKGGKKFQVKAKKEIILSILWSLLVLPTTFSAKLILA